MRHLEFYEKNDHLAQNSRHPQNLRSSLVKYYLLLRLRKNRLRGEDGTTETADVTSVGHQHMGDDVDTIID